MTSDARETSLLGGQPYSLYRFTRGIVHWYYTSADRPIVHDGAVYLPAAIAHGKIQSGGESQQRTLDITLPKNLPVSDNWRPYPPGDAIMLTILTQHWGEGDYLVDWIGRLISPKFDNTTLQLSSEPTQTIAKRAGRGRVIQRGCDLIVFSQGDGLCNVDLSLHQLPATVIAVSGLTITATEFLAFPDGRLAGGWIEWTREDGIVERRSIESHSGNSVEIDYGAFDLAPGLMLDAAPGCAGTWEDCEYFENTVNFGGELFMPGRSYFDGNPV